MHCPDEQTLTAFSDGELAPGQAGDVERHLAGCRACAEAVQDLRQLNALGRSALAGIVVTPAAMARTVGAPARRDAGSIPSGRRFRFPWRAGGVAAAAAAALAVMAGRWLITQPPDGRDPIGAPVAGTTTPVGVRPIEAAAPPPLLDHDFARWSAEHQRPRIPRIPLEQLADYDPAPMRPTLGPDAKPQS